MTSTISRLPPELLHQIQLHLSSDPLSALSFALVHPVIYHSTNHKVWSGLISLGRKLRERGWLSSDEYQQWSDFVSLIGRAWKGWWWCERCLVLHPTDPTGNLEREGGRESTERYEALAIGPGGMFQDCSITLDPRIVRGVMQRHVEGEPAGLCPEYLRAYKSWEHPSRMIMADMNTSYEFRACQLLWEGRWDFTYFGKDMLRAEDYENGDIWIPLQDEGLRKCSHMAWKPRLQVKPTWRQALRSRATAAQRKRPPPPEPIREELKNADTFLCWQCSTSVIVRERQRNFKRHGFESTQFTIIINKNFGTLKDSIPQAEDLGHFRIHNEFANHFSPQSSHTLPKKAQTDWQVIPPAGDFGTQPLFYPCGSHGHSCYVVKGCVHEARELEQQGMKPNDIDWNSWLQFSRNFGFATGGV